MMKDASVGGLTVQRRSLCGDAPDSIKESVREAQNKFGSCSFSKAEFEKLYACNGHHTLSAKDTETGIGETPKCVVCFDVNSLYPASSMERGLPFGPGKFYTSETQKEALCLNKYQRARDHYEGRPCLCRPKGILDIDRDKHDNERETIVDVGEEKEEEEEEGLVEQTKINIGAGLENVLLLQHSNRPAGDGQEFLWSQYKTISLQKTLAETETRDNKKSIITLAASSFHVGPGQSVMGVYYGGSDLLLIVIDKGMTHLKFQNFHGRQRHNNNCHWESCHHKANQPAYQNQKNVDGSNKPIQNNRLATDDQDYHRDLFCKYMSETHWRSDIIDTSTPRLYWEYTTDRDCDIFCNNPPRHIENYLKLYKDDTLLPIRLDKLKVSEIFKLMDTEADLSGFVTLSGGKETNVGDVEDDYGFCMQKLVYHSDKVGPYTRAQLISMAGNDPKKLARMLKIYLDPKKAMTTTSKSFASKGVTISLEYFKWLVSQRGLVDYKVVHLYLTRVKPWQTPWFEDLLQSRQDNKNNPLKNHGAKLCVNSNYGRFGMDSSRYQATDVVTKTTLNRNSKFLEGLDVIHFNLLCAFPQKRFGKTKKSRGPQLEFVFGITYNRRDLEFSNYQIAAAFILNQSKKIYFNHMLLCSRLFDPRKSQDCYGDTDSMIWTFSRMNLKENYRSNLSEEEILQLEKTLFEDSNSSRHQTGKLKIEHVHQYAIFRNQKTYKLCNRMTQEGVFQTGSYIKIRSISRRLHSSFEDRHFIPDPEINTGTARACFMRKTEGLEIIIAQEDRSLPHCLNFRRFVTVITYNAIDIGPF